MQACSLTTYTITACRILVACPVNAHVKQVQPNTNQKIQTMQTATSLPLHAQVHKK